MNLKDQQVAIRVDRLFQMLPDDVRRKNHQAEKKDNGTDKPKKPRTEDWWLDAPYNVEWNYELTPPAGFIAKELPKDATIQIGPALLTENFSTGKDGVVLAHLVFDTEKRRYTVAEATTLRNEIADLIGGPAILGH